MDGRQVSNGIEQSDSKHARETSREMLKLIFTSKHASCVLLLYGAGFVLLLSTANNRRKRGWHARVLLHHTNGRDNNPHQVVGVPRLGRHPLPCINSQL